MKTIAIPINNNKQRESMPSPHFGRSPYYYIIDDINDPSKDRIIKNTSKHFGGDKGPPALLKENNIDVLIAVGLGKNAMSRFDENGIEIYQTERKPVKIIIERFRNNQLSKISDPCEHSHHEHHTH